MLANNPVIAAVCNSRDIIHALFCLEFARSLSAASAFQRGK